ncbi:MAG: V-type ATPase subunit [Nitrospirae bacterium]|nr:V-type ATPase subunit [Nitrospirota bacterium]
MDDYAYLNARIRFLRSELLDPRVYGELMSLPDLISARGVLGKTVYEKVLGDSSDRPSLSRLEAGIREEWARTVNKIHQMTDGRPKAYLQGLTAWWEGENLKAILRGKTNHFGEQEIFSILLPIGSLNPSALRELVRQPSVQGMVDRLVAWRSPYAKPLNIALKNQPDLKRLDLLELSLDRFIFEEVFKKITNGGQDASLFHQLAGLMVDKLNLLTAFKVFREGGFAASDPADYFIRGGNHVILKVFQKVARAQDLNDAIEMIKKTPYSGVVAGIKPEGELFPALRLEIGLNRFILRRARKMGVDDPLGFGLIAGYFLQKYFEVVNLRMIFRTKSYGMYDSDIRSLLVV